MRRLALLLPLLAATPAFAQSGPFCAGIARLVEQAPGGFGDLPLSLKLIPGSIQERRGILTPRDGTAPKQIYVALMVQDSTPQGTQHAQAQFRTLHAEIARCVSQVAQVPQGQPMTEPQGGAVWLWTLPSAQILLRGSAGNAQGADSATALVEIQVAERF